MKITHWFLAFAIVLAFSSPVAGLSADAPSHAVQSKPTETTGHLSRHEIIKRLQLTDEQHKMLRQHRAAYRKAMALLDGQLKVKQVELENEIEKPEPDQAKLDLVVQKIGELYGQRLSEKVKAKLELEKKILTPQQVDLLKTLQGKEGQDENL